MKKKRHAATGPNMSTRSIIGVIKRAEAIIRDEAAQWKDSTFGRGQWSDDEIDRPVIEDYATYMAIAEDLGFAADILQDEYDLEEATAAVNTEPEEEQEEQP